MRKLMLLSLIILLLALNCMAIETVQLGGDSGKAILTQVASLNVTNQTTKASQGDLRNWGKIPMNYELDKSGKPKRRAQMMIIPGWRPFQVTYRSIQVSMCKEKS